MSDLRDNFKFWMRELVAFLISPLFLKNLALMVGLVVLLAVLADWWLGCHTRHGESVEVDEFIGMYLDDAKKAGKSKGFRFEVMDSVWMEGKPRGIIVLQNPAPNNRVKEGRKIYVTITGLASPEMLPKFSDSSYDYDRYAAKLARRGIRSKVRERVFDSKQAENTILYFYHNNQKITEKMVKTGYKVMPGDLLEFVVTEKTSNEMEIPDLVCMNFQRAEFLVSTSNLNIGQIFEDETVSDRNTAFIYKQEPPFALGQTIQMGGQINIWLTQNLPVFCSGSSTPESESEY